jgi:octaprenyl-diphosphate synthase
MSAPKVNLEDVLGPVAGGLERMRSMMIEQLTDHSASVRDMTDHISRFRGKQLRGALVLLVGEATGNTTDEHPQVAAIVEMIHLATLVHDDVLDGAEVRRRVACVNERWDNQVAVLLGDFLYARAFALSTDLSSRLASRMLSDTTRRLCVGEIDQSQRRYDFEMPQDVYESIAGAKTATLYAAACELGARYPGGNEDTGSEMRSLGWELGLSFQIIDDCLDVTGTQEAVGKSVGNDVEDGKVTLPVLHVYAGADETTRAAIRDAYTAPGIEGRAQHLREVVDLEPGVDYALARAQQLIEQARRRIAELPPTPARTALDALTAFVLERNW